MSLMCLHFSYIIDVMHQAGIHYAIFSSNEPTELSNIATVAMIRNSFISADYWLA